MDSHPAVAEPESLDNSDSEDASLLQLTDVTQSDSLAAEGQAILSTTSINTLSADVRLMPFCAASSCTAAPDGVAAVQPSFLLGVASAAASSWRESESDIGQLLGPHGTTGDPNSEDQASLLHQTTRPGESSSSDSHVGSPVGVVRRQLSHQSMSWALSSVGSQARPRSASSGAPN